MPWEVHEKIVENSSVPGHIIVEWADVEVVEHGDVFEINGVRARELEDGTVIKKQLRKSEMYGKVMGVKKLGHRRKREVRREGQRFEELGEHCGNVV